MSSRTDSPENVLRRFPQNVPRNEKSTVPGFRVGDLVCTIAIAGLCATAVALLSGEPSRLGSDIAGLLFLFAALTYGGTMLTWWSVFAPISALLLFIPIGHWEATGALFASGGLLRAALVPAMSLIAGSLLVSLRLTRFRAIEGHADLNELKLKGLSHIRELQKLEITMSDITSSLNETRYAPLENSSESRYSVASDSSEPAMPRQWDAIEFRVDEGTLISAQESDVVGHKELQRMVEAELDRMIAAQPNHRARFSFTMPIDVPIPLAVRGRLSTLQLTVRELLKRALVSLGGQEGVVRVTLRPNLRTMTLSIEDNGRGLNEEIVLKLEAKGLVSAQAGEMRLSEIRQLIEGAGWSMQMQARLGVGSRVTLELPRVDAYRYGARTELNREMLRGSVSVSVSGEAKASELPHA